MHLPTDCGPPPPARSSRITGWSVLHTLLVLVLLVDGVAKALRFAPYVEGTLRVGYPASCAGPLGLVLVACTVLYVVRRTSVLGAILLTAYLGGATATHVRMGEPFVFPVVVGVLVWACLLAREARVQALFGSPTTSPWNC